MADVFSDDASKDGRHLNKVRTAAPGIPSSFGDDGSNGATAYSLVAVDLDAGGNLDIVATQGAYI